MDKLYSCDIFKIYKNYEPSRHKIWEIVRSFNPIEFAQLLYLLENVTKSSKRDTISLHDAYIKYPKIDCPNVLLKITDSPTIRLERCTFHNESSDMFWNDGTKNNNDDIKDTTDDFDINTLLNHVRSNNILNPNDTSESELIPNVTTTNLRDVRFKVLNHNIGTQCYHKFLKHIEHLLFNDNLQTDRNEHQTQQMSIVLKFMQFYKTMNFKQSLDNDSRNFRNLIIPQPIRIFNRDLINDPNYIIQPLYQGFHVIVYSSPHETKCYSRFGTLQPNLAYSIRCNVPCTFEAIILPIDKFGNERCWRYWTFKSGFVMYVVDVFRYKQTILTMTPFKDRAKYIKLIVDNQINMRSAMTEHHTWLSIEERYIKNQDIYDPIVGVVLRDPNHIFSVTSSITKPMHQPKLFYFNILYTFDMLNQKIINLCTNYELSTIQTLHLNYEMADYKTICLAYGHCNQFIYLCTYNRNVHQFVHAAVLQRSYREYTTLNYKPESIYVVNNKIVPQGIMYIRIYYDLMKNIIGYESKNTDDRFKVMYKNPLLEL